MGGMVESEIARTLDVADAQTKYDAAARKLVAQKAVLAYILKSALDEFSEVPVKEISEKYIEGIPQVSEIAVHQDEPDAPLAVTEKMSGSDRIEGKPTEETSIREGTVRYDIRFVVHVPGNDERIEIIVNLELQNNDKPGYPIPKRGIYYGSRLISAQRGTVFKNQEYGKIKKVASIWVCEGAAEERSDTINEYRFTEKCKRGAYHEEQKDYDLVTIIVMRLGALGEKSEDDAIRLLSKVFSPEMSADDKKAVLEDEFHIEVTEEMKGDVNCVCNLSTGILDKGIAIGVEKGTLETLFGLVKKGLLSITAAAEEANMEPSAFEQKYKSYCR